MGERGAGTWQGTVGGWWSGVGALPTTVAGAETCLLLAFLGLRGTDVVQLLLATPTGLQESTAPAIDALLILGYLGQTAVLTVVLVRARRFLSTFWATVECTAGVLILLAEPLFTATTDRVGTWTAWGYGLSLCSAFGAGIGYPRRSQTLIAATALAGAYLLVSLPGSGALGTTGTVVSNVVAYFGFALFPRALASYLRRLAAAADDARDAAARAGRAAERDRQRRLLHDHETLMRLLADPSVDPALAELLRRQAISGANRVRSFLTAPPEQATEPDGDERPLTDLVRAVVSEFSDLPIEASIDLARGVLLPAADATAVCEALATLLHNVRRHAGARSVVVHADGDDDSWEVTVRDDGVGFDPATTPLGFGLRDLVIGALAARGIAATVESAPGEGTAVVLTGTASHAASGRTDARP